MLSIPIPNKRLYLIKTFKNAEFFFLESVKMMWGKFKLYAFAATRKHILYILFISSDYI